MVIAAWKVTRGSNIAEPSPQWISWLRALFSKTGAGAIPADCLYLLRMFNETGKKDYTDC